RGLDERKEDHGPLRDRAGRRRAQACRHSQHARLPAGGASVMAANETVTPVQPAKRAIEWTARYRASGLERQDHNRFVGVMKRGLPIAAVALLTAVVAYSLQPRLQNTKKLALTMQRIGILNNDLMMIKPKLTGVDGEGNPYVVTAEEAIQDVHDGKQAQL